MKHLEKKYDQLKMKLKEIDFITRGSISTVYTKCGNDYCACKEDDSKKHGPYFLWTRKEKGKTVSLHLSKQQVNLCKKYFKNYKKMKEIIDKMVNLSIQFIKEKPKK